MEIFTAIDDLRKSLEKKRSQALSIGLVPTMGALHAGHLALIDSSKRECDVTMATIFVNPAQFNNPNDLENYPISLEEDLSLLKKAGCNIAFTPSTKEIFPYGTSQFNIPDRYNNQMEGIHRPGHFSGVALVIFKLFNITAPQKAFFGQKDLQQFSLIKWLQKEFFFPIEVEMVPTVREKDGLACSSRNRRLADEPRKQAPIMYKALSSAGHILTTGGTLATAKNKFHEMMASSTNVRVEYFDIVETENLEPVNHLNQQETLALCAACQIGEIRLIDNIIIRQNH